MDDIRLSVKPQMALVVDKCETATEKIEELTKFKAKIMQEIDDTINNISTGYIYCEKCGKWYKNRAWEVKVIKEPRKVWSATFRMMEEPDIVYAEKDIIVRRLECPVGHLQPYQSLDIASFFENEK